MKHTCDDAAVAAVAMLTITAIDAAVRDATRETATGHRLTFDASTCP